MGGPKFAALLFGREAIGIGFNECT